MRLFEVQEKVASKLGVEPTKILSGWITETQKELGMPTPNIWSSAGNRAAPPCPERYKAEIIAVLQGGE